MYVSACRRVRIDEHSSLGTDVYLPAAGGRYPVVLSRTPYNRTGMQAKAAYFTSFGYAFVAQDVRGRWDSDGEIDPLVHEQEDGQATLQWVAEQSWCDGRIGMYGASYDGMAQWQAALSGHPALRCIAPAVAPGSFIREWVYPGGCFAWANMICWLQMWTCSRSLPPMGHLSWERLWQMRDLDSVRQACGFLSPVLERWLEQDGQAQKADHLDVSAHANALRVPILHTAGWWDHLSRFNLGTALSGHPNGLPQHLVVGPWGHVASGGRASDDQTAYGDWRFTDAARMDTRDLTRRFFDRYLKDDNGAFGDQPYARAYIMGQGRWHDSDQWPPAEAERQKLYLSGRGRASETEGQLRFDAPETTGEMAYGYDPADPCPTRGGPIYWGLAERYGCGPIDLRPTLDRHDVAVFRSPPLETPATILGPVDLTLNVRTDVDDTDLVVRFAVEDPITGAVYPLLVGPQRLRYRDGFDDPKPVTPGTPMRVTIPLGSSGYTCPVGGRWVLMVTSSDFPHLLAHTNRYGGTRADEPMRVAHLILQSGGINPSHLSMSVLPG